jgi:hypothetical protein
MIFSPYKLVGSVICLTTTKLKKINYFVGWYNSPSLNGNDAGEPKSNPGEEKSSTSKSMSGGNQSSVQNKKTRRTLNQCCWRPRLI